MTTPTGEPYGIHPDATAQEVFDKVARHLFAQGKRAMRPGGKSCGYRGAEKTACAAGCLVADADYTPRMENEPVDVLVIAARHGAYSGAPSLPFIRDGAIGGHSKLVTALQNVHDWSDGWTDTDAMRRELRLVALAYRLDPAILGGLSFADR